MRTAHFKLVRNALAAITAITIVSGALGYAADATPSLASSNQTVAAK